jgi:hypothetical protein
VIYLAKKGNTAVALGLVCIALIVASGFGAFAPYVPAWIPTTPSGGTGGTGGTSGGGVTTLSAVAKWFLQEKLSKTAVGASDTAYVGIVKANSAGQFDLLNSYEETELDANPDTSSKTYTSGDKLLFAVSSDDDMTGGYEAYPRWFLIDNLQKGAIVYALPLRNPISAIGGSVGAYTVDASKCEDTGQRVAFVGETGGSSQYWDFGTFELYGRVAKDYLIQQITNKGVIGCTLNDGATWEDTDAEINANFTFTADEEDLHFELIGEASNVAFGLPTLSVSSTGMVRQHKAVLVFATDALSMADITPLLSDGWKQIDKPDMTADIAFYYEIDPVRDGCIPDTGEVINVNIPISISDSGLTASTEYEFEGWVLDWQVIEYVASGITTTTLPTNNGFISDPGCDSIVEPLALTISSGSVATMQLLGHFTTNA